MGKYFGVHGIRGKANNGTMNPFVLPRIAVAIGVVFGRGGEKDHVYKALMGKDTRRSNYAYEGAFELSLPSVGMELLMTGPMPTSGVAYLTRSMRANVGIMLTASHNGYEDSGIKLFGPNGLNITKEQEAEIEHLADSPDLLKYLAKPVNIAGARRIEGAQDRYIEFAKGSLQKEVSFGGVRVVVDSANGAGYKVVPEALRELDVDVISIGNEPDGFNINKECGSTSPEALSKKVVEMRADLGIALDGDADRVILIDEKGKLIDGDQILALIARSWKEEGRLEKPVAVGTSMSNLGLERFLKGEGIELVRTDVGDHNIAKRMQDEGYAIGGEQTGHIISRYTGMIGDGLVAALKSMAIIQKKGGKASEVCHLYKPVPQLLKNVQLKKGQESPHERPNVQQVIAKANESFGESGRVIVRPSGTEPVVRVMVESDDKDKQEAVASSLVEIIKDEIR